MLTVLFLQKGNKNLFYMVKLWTFQTKLFDQEENQMKHLNKLVSQRIEKPLPFSF